MSVFHRLLRHLCIVHGGEAAASCQVIGNGPVQINRLGAGRAVPAKRNNGDGQRIFNAGIDKYFQFPLGLGLGHDRQ